MGPSWIPHTLISHQSFANTQKKDGVKDLVVKRNFFPIVNLSMNRKDEVINYCNTNRLAKKAM